MNPRSNLELQAGAGKDPSHKPQRFSRSKKGACLVAEAYTAQKLTQCLVCRRRHVKCDETRPSCQRCARGKRICEYSSFEEQEANLASNHDGADNENRASPRPQPPTVGHPSATSPPFRQSLESLSTTVSALELDCLGSDHTSLPVPSRPCSDRLLFRLFSHYTEVVAPWLALTDPDQHFRHVVPHEAFSFPILFNAIIALSAQQLHMLHGLDIGIADLFHQRCIVALIAALSHQVLAADGRVLAATVILRMFEMLRQTDNRDPQHHLLGSCSLVELPTEEGNFHELRVAAFWVYLRQDVHMAERHQRCTLLNLNHSFVNIEGRLWLNNCDDNPANHVTCLFARTLNYCFASAAERDDHEFNALTNELDNWFGSLPPAYAPVFQGPNLIDRQTQFPVLWYLADWHVFALQTFHMAKLLLNLHAPPITTRGIEALQSMREQELKFVVSVLPIHVKLLESMLASICASADWLVPGVGKHKRNSPKPNTGLINQRIHHLLPCLIAAAQNRRLEKNRYVCCRIRKFMMLSFVS
ncbi:hypothetical protein M409DRAFT_52646 [Zasmidium cellare ATCC 36951]|uniref:Zn(2)-C6 fungal-type domain-containing protein n=1 Tax=Zasmidium cellare ATCC 36951 TaxID=1080233 RepID=A0A6A6CT90_ZASCE|nr:uncharacterized protein M409DRAFT_52646 [Zasmidium cellare ATCC 36951]KAF2169398.1 hypothetical protein M409DRAFT_52646 [Zasmidium cellare ATCC 36951]